MTTFNTGGLAIGPYGSEYASLTYDNIGNTWVSNIPLVVEGNIISTGAILSNVVVVGDLQVDGNINTTGADLRMSGFSVVAGQINSTYGYIAGGNIITTTSLHAPDAYLSNTLHVTNNAAIGGTLYISNNLNVTGTATANLISSGRVTANLATIANTLTAGQIYIANNSISNTTGGQINVSSKMNFTGGIDGAPVALVFFGQR